MVIHHPETDMRSQSNNSQTDGFTKKLYSKKYSKCPSRHSVKKATALTRLGKGKGIFLSHQKHISIKAYTKAKILYTSRNMSTSHVKEYLHAFHFGIYFYASYIHIQCNINTYLRYSHKAQEPIYVYFCTNKDYNIVILFLLLP